MRLGFRKAGRGRTRGKSDNVNNPRTAPRAASRRGCIDPWPPPCPDEVMSGRGGSGAGGSRCGTAPAGALCCARARGGRGLRASPVTSVACEATTTSVVLWALLMSVDRVLDCVTAETTTECRRFDRPETLRASRSRAALAFGGAVRALPGSTDVVEIGAEAAAAAGWVAAAISACAPSTADDTGILAVVMPATFVLTLWTSRVGACETAASTSVSAASISADTSMPAGPAARAVPGAASPLQTITPAKAHARASKGTQRPAAAARKEVVLLFSMLRSVAGDELPGESSRAAAFGGRAHLAGLRSPQMEVFLRRFGERHRPEQSTPPRLDHGGDTAIDLELAHGVTQILLDGMTAQVQAGADLPIRATLGRKLQHPELLLRQARPSSGGPSGEEHLRDGRINEALSRSNPPENVGEIGLWSVLEQVCTGAGSRRR